MRIWIPMVAVLAASTAQAQGSSAPPAPPGEEPPAGVELLMPRGGIPAIFEPVFVGGADAALPADAWVLGVAHGGEARAYSLNLLNSHEVVNDVVGGRPLAAVW